MVKSYTSSGPMHLDENKIRRKKKDFSGIVADNEVLSYALFRNSSDVKPVSDHRATNISLVYGLASMLETASN